MEDIPISYSYFIAALNYTKDKEGSGFQNSLAITVKKSEPYISKVINQKSIASFYLQNRIAEACGYEYDDFLSFGKKLNTEGNKIKTQLYVNRVIEKIKYIELSDLKLIDDLVNRLSKK